MKIWNSAPLIRLLFPFIAGIFAAVCFPFLSTGLSFFLFLLFTLIVVYTFTPAFGRYYRFSWWYGIIVNGLFFLIGYQFTILKTDQFSPFHYSRSYKQAKYIQVRVISPCTEREKSIKAIVEWISVTGKQKQPVIYGKALVYFQKDSRSLKLNYGDELILKNTFRKTTAPQNPGEFDYQRFLFYKNIVHQAYLKPSDWIYTGKNTGNMLIRFSMQLRNKLLLIFKDAHLNGDEFAVASALLLGYTDKLDVDLLSAYSETGTLHVLSVSGLHVAIVFVVFNRMLFFLDKLKYGRLMKVALLLLLLWFYALLSGLSPSVLRSTTMFSFVICARSFKRNSNIYNTLAASAMLLLLCNPYLLMDVGFQLSYLAVAGIVYLQPYLSGLMKTDSWLLQQIAEMTSVSIAAQLATLPVSLYYFHQFPNYFLISNLLVIPLSTCIMYLGMLLIAVSGNKWILSCIAIVFSKTLALLNALVIYISRLPCAVTDRIFIDLPEIFLLYGLIISLHLFFSKKKSCFLKQSLCIIIILLAFQVIKQMEGRQQKKMIVYNIPHGSVIDFISGRQHVAIVDSIRNNGYSWMKHTKPNWDRWKLLSPIVVCSSVKTTFLCMEQGIIQFYNRKLMLVTDSKRIKSLHEQGKKLVVDEVIVSKNVQISISEILEVCKPECIVFDASNSYRKLEKWKKECTQLHQHYHSVPDSGAFTVELSTSGFGY